MSSVYDIITERVIRSVESGNLPPWRKAWSGGLADVNLVSGKAYRGINRLLLPMSGQPTPYWLTFRQVTALGGTVRKGQHGTPVIFWKMLESKDKETGEKDTIPMLRYYTVFNAAQCDGLDTPAVETRVIDPIAQAELIIAGYANAPQQEIGAVGSSFKPCYYPQRDLVQMPNIAQFASAEDFYDSYFHELVHSTGHETRLHRELTNNKGNKSGYGREELVAEIGSAFLCQKAGIDNSHININQEAYISGWLAAIREDTRALVVAAGKAEKAADYILGTIEPKTGDEN